MKPVTFLFNRWMGSVHNMRGEWAENTFGSLADLIGSRIREEYPRSRAEWWVIRVTAAPKTGRYRLRPGVVLDLKQDDWGMICIRGAERVLGVRLPHWPQRVNITVRKRRDRWSA